MSSGVALGIGLGLGVLLMVAIALWTVLRGSASLGAAYVVLGVMIVVVVGGAIVAGSFRSAIIFTLSFGVGVALSSVVTLPLGAFAKSRHGQRSG